MTEDGAARQLRLCVVGSAGRLAAAISSAAQSANAIVNAAIDNTDSDPDSSVEFDIVIDASSPAGTLRASEIALNKGVPLIVCTTGLPSESIDALKEAAVNIPVLIAPNTSPGVAVVARLVEVAASLLSDWTVQIEETHHTKKKDKPSGTARLFADFVESGSGHPVPSEAIQSHRKGDVVGEHTVAFTGPSEVIRIEHQALDRVLFGQGAIRAAFWLLGKPAGLYTIQQTLE